MKLKSFKEALEKSIKQWDWMAKQPDGTEKFDYFLRRRAGDIPSAECYLCQWQNEQHWGEYGCPDCQRLHIWGKGHEFCCNPNSPFYQWGKNPTAANAAKVRDALVAALERIEK
jgi:hypothetical protein